MNKTLCVAALALLLSACGEQAGAKKAVLAALKDPDSAKFGKFSLAGKNGACLTVNAKNSMGGYTGDQQASLCKVNGEWEAVGVDKLSHEQCLQVVSELC